MTKSGTAKDWRGKGRGCNSGSPLLGVWEYFLAGIEDSWNECSVILVGTSWFETKIIWRSK